MFGALWPGFDADDVPIASVTNGVHAPTWTDPQVSGLAESKLGTSDTHGGRLGERPGDGCRALGPARTAAASSSSPMPGRASPRRGPRTTRASATPKWFGELLDPEVLTIGFARRVPTYKRLTLMLHDPERLRALLDRPGAPGAAGHRRQVASGRRRGQAPHPEARRVLAGAGCARADRLPAELRHRHGAAALPRHRHLAQQPAASARGVRHLGHEGGAQRRRSTCRSSTAGGTSTSTTATAGRSRLPTARAMPTSATLSRRPRCTT